MELIMNKVKKFLRDTVLIIGGPIAAIALSATTLALSPLILVADAIRISSSKQDSKKESLFSKLGNYFNQDSLGKEDDAKIFGKDSKKESLFSRLRHSFNRDSVDKEEDVKIFEEAPEEKTFTFSREPQQNPLEQSFPYSQIVNSIGKITDHGLRTIAQRKANLTKAGDDVVVSEKASDTSLPERTFRLSRQPQQKYAERHHPDKRNQSDRQGAMA